MYRFDWIENLKLGTAPVPTSLSRVSPVVWKLGWTSMLTDISSEMVNSVLPAYLVLFLHLNPLEFGIIDGLYHGVAVALLALSSGLAADRTGRYREIAALGYGLSAVCKIALLFAGGAFTWLAAITTIDRLGKGARTAPRDALISLHSAPELLATSFSVHRALDAGGALLGPMLAFGLLAWLPGRYDTVWLTSFVFALLGLGVIALLVPNPESPAPRSLSLAHNLHLAACLFRTSVTLRPLAAPALLLALATASDSFLYLTFSAKTQLSASYIPLFFLITAGLYMLLSMPVGRLADRVGRKHVLLGGYLCLAGAYLLLWLAPAPLSLPLRAGFFLLLGLYYAATEGILTAMASAAIPSSQRGSALALLASLTGLGKMASSLAFGWLSFAQGFEFALPVFAFALAAALGFSAVRIPAPLTHEAA